MRTLIVMLSLAVFFLIGLVIGMDRENQANQTDSDKTVEQAEEKQVIVEELPEEEPEMSDSPDHLTQKTAQFLESGVKGFYEIVVGMTYDLVQVFF
ncbi:hypothetical protein GCM10028778_09120 [Barrientosiimonas marina]|uniref:DUF3679 domain-containing protein n=1 Tax=Lentibacillus kimchii TaxID=1542911 RepID=A0ABW2UVW6_9BACI